MPVCAHCGELFEEGPPVCPHCGFEVDADWSPEPEWADFEAPDESETPEKRAGCAVCLLLPLICVPLLLLL